jgi:2-polyprenyl-3-methyl-5-hydroxy-6-metoxy-1,4-benzoquinol methylase
MNLIIECPNGCKCNLMPSGLIVTEGELNECSMCGQLVSSCSKTYYEISNQIWNTEEGTWPSRNASMRFTKRKTRDINNLAKLLVKNRSNIHILDVGCSNGSFVSIANSLGLRAEGVDPSENAITDGFKKGLNLHTGFLDEVAFPDNSFDAITLYEVIEHVSDSSSLFKECARILRPNGILLVGTGNVDSWTRRIKKHNWDFFDMEKHGGHINFFSPKSLSILAPRVGFRVVKIDTSSVKFFEKSEMPAGLYRIFKVLSEILNLPAKFFNKGHQMEVYLQNIK